MVAVRYLEGASMSGTESSYQLTAILLYIFAGSVFVKLAATDQRSLPALQLLAEAFYHKKSFFSGSKRSM